MKKLEREGNKPANLKELVEQNYLSLALLPKDNDFLIREGSSRGSSDGILDLRKIDGLQGYLVFLTEKDYGALSPSMWNSLFRRLNLNYNAIYFVGDPKNAETIVQAFRTDPKYLGGGFGSGWKEQFGYLDLVSPETLKSVNFIVRDSETQRLVGYNTDVEGLILPLREKLRELEKEGIKGRNFLLLGAGGVGKELSHSLVREGVSRLYLVNRTVEKVKELSEELNKIREGVVECASEDEMEGFLLRPDLDVIVNVTKKGAEPLQDYSSFAQIEVRDPQGVKNNNEKSLALARRLSQVNPNVIVYDITLPKTGVSKTLEIAEEAGLKNLIGGMGMVVNQGIIASELLYRANPSMFKNNYDNQIVRDTFDEATK